MFVFDRIDRSGNIAVSSVRESDALFKFLSSLSLLHLRHIRARRFATSLQFLDSFHSSLLNSSSLHIDRARGGRKNNKRIAEKDNFSSSNLGSRVLGGSSAAPKLICCLSPIPLPLPPFDVCLPQGGECQDDRRLCLCWCE